MGMQPLVGGFQEPVAIQRRVRGNQMARVATHQGECQGCGRVQKLPGGALSLHGYTVQWGFFNGTCGGAKHLPYELSSDYCKACIVSAKASMEASLAAAKKYRREIAEPIADFVEVPIGRDPRTNKPRSAMVQNLVLSEVPLREGSDYRKIIGTYERDGEMKTVDVTGNTGAILAHDHSIRTPLDAARRLNERLAKEQDLYAAQLKSYIVWQQGRVDKWKLRTLKPVPKDVPEVAGKGELSLLKNISQTVDGRTISDRSRYSYTSRVTYNRGRKLVRLGLAELLDEGQNNQGNWIKIKATDAGTQRLAQLEQE